MQRAFFWIAGAVLMVLLGWMLLTTLSRVLRETEPDVVDAGPLVTPTEPADTPAAAAQPRIRVKLFFTSEDGMNLVPVEREIPLAEGVVPQAREIVLAQLAETPPETLGTAIPEGTTLRGLYLSNTNEMFIDLDGTVRSKHPGGSMNEIFTIYTLVNAITVNLPDVQHVQILIDGREADTLAGHVDLRRPLRKNEAVMQQ